MARPVFSTEEMRLALVEAAATLSTAGTSITAEQVQQALLETLNLKEPADLLTSPWTPDIIVHHVLDYDFGG